MQTETFDADYDYMDLVNKTLWSKGILLTNMGASSDNSADISFVIESPNENLHDTIKEIIESCGRPIRHIHYEKDAPKWYPKEWHKPAYKIYVGEFKGALSRKQEA